jgi:hypothetical protein
MTALDRGSWALVTGASGGLGAEFAQLLAERGCNLVLVARSAEALTVLAETLARAHGVAVHVEVLDLALPDAAAELKRRTDRQGLRIDVLINNAGVGVHGDFAGADPQRLQQMLDLNVSALTRLARLYGEDMRRRGRGHMLLVSSLLGFMASPVYAAYAATKAYVLSLGEALHDELAPHGVTVTVLAPGLTDTAFTRTAGHKVSATLALMLMKPRPVAEAGLRALEAGRACVVPGFMNKLSAWSTRFTPRGVHRRIMQALLA